MKARGLPRGGIERTLHWVNAVAVLVLIASGWQIHAAAPLVPLAAPAWLTLGGDLTGALRWHFAAMWPFALTSVALIGRRLVPGAGVRLLPVSSRAVLRDAGAALRGRLGHGHASYNAVQRLAYLACFALLVLALASGLALWKPMQLRPVAHLFGGYEGVRRVHFAAMAGITGFVALHATMALLVPRTLAAMVLGLRRGGGTSRGDSGERT